MRGKHDAYDTEAIREAADGRCLHAKPRHADKKAGYGDLPAVGVSNHWCVNQVL